MNISRDMLVEVLRMVDQLDPAEEGIHQEAICAHIPWERTLTMACIKDLVESGDLYPVEPRVYKNISPWSRL